MNRKGSIIKLPSPSFRNALATRIEAAHLNVHSARAYLDKRQINDESIENFQLGYDQSTGRLTIPYLSPAGPWNVKYRCIQSHNCKDAGHGKYLYDAGAGVHLYNAPALLAAETVVVVEGEIDAISVNQLGISAVAYPGTAMWKANPHWRWCFDSLVEVIVVADGDQQGRKAAADVADSLRNSVSADVRVVDLPDGQDSNSYITEHGDVDFMNRLDLL